MYLYMCVCVCLCVKENERINHSNSSTQPLNDVTRSPKFGLKNVQSFVSSKSNTEIELEELKAKFINGLVTIQDTNGIILNQKVKISQKN
jgi:hypothetical protein